MRPSPVLALLALAALLCGADAARAADLPADPACEAARHPRDHVGETLRFRGVLDSDVIERATLTPLGCPRAFKIGTIAAGAAKALDDDVMPGFYPRGGEATFAGVIVRTRSGGPLLSHDDGVRFDIFTADDVRRAGF
jgi:hypothetical protein